MICAARLFQQARILFQTRKGKSPTSGCVDVRNAEMTWWNTIVKYEQHVVILNFGVNERTVTEKLWRCWDGWKFENFRKIRDEERFQPRPHSLLGGKREDPWVQGEILVPDLTLTANFKMAAKEDTWSKQWVSYLYSVGEILPDFRIPCVFSLLRDLQNWGRLESNDKKSPSWRRVWAVWLRPKISLVLQKNTGPSGLKANLR